MEEKMNNNFEDVLVEEGELSKEELEGVTGGRIKSSTLPVERYFVCGDCKHVLNSDKPLHTCDNCGSHNIVQRERTIIY